MKADEENKERFNFRVWRYVAPDMPEYELVNLFNLNTYVRASEIIAIDQCTGKKDKDNWIIYEGDIVHLKHYCFVGKCPIEITIDGPIARFIDGFVRLSQCDNDQLEIIGNIHELKDKPEDEYRDIEEKIKAWVEGLPMQIKCSLGLDHYATLFALIKEFFEEKRNASKS